MNNSWSMAFIAAGILFAVFGVNEMSSFTLDSSHAFTATPTDHSVWMLVAGVVMVAVGLIGVVSRSRKN